MEHRKLAILSFVLLCSFASHSAGVVWNSFQVDDFSSWVEGAWIMGAPLPYSPGIGFLGDGSVWTEGCFNADGGGSYWVHSAYGDELSTFDDYLSQILIADVGYTGDEVITGTGVSGHEYLAVIGHTSNLYDPTAEIVTYYGWVELNGKSIVSSAITADGPLRIGTGDVIPEPSSGLLALMGLTVILLKRKRRFGGTPCNVCDVRSLQFRTSSISKLLSEAENNSPKGNYLAFAIENGSDF